MQSTDSTALIVDDDARITRLVRRAAEKAGFEAVELQDPTKFADQYREATPSVVFLDLSMPGKDGVELISTIASFPHRSVLVLLSGNDVRVIESAKSLAENRGLEVVATLRKPVEIAELLQTLEQVSKSVGVFSIEDFDLALDEQQFETYFQPKIDVATGDVAGAEALARWNRPGVGFVSPEVFVDFAERNDRIDGLTEKVLRDAAHLANKIRQSSDSNFGISVNISPVSLLNDSLPENMAGIVAAEGLDPRGITLELTERGAMVDEDQSKVVLTRLRLKGFNLSIDDFGTGLSSLVQLYRMPFSEIKIDKSFVLDMLRKEEASIIVKSIVDLANNMNLEVVAEGVEDEPTLAGLRERGCRTVQGYFFSKPLPDDKFVEWLNSYLKSR